MNELRTRLKALAVMLAASGNVPTDILDAAIIRLGHLEDIADAARRIDPADPTGSALLNLRHALDDLDGNTP